jgi:hypothetical protein
MTKAIRTVSFGRMGAALLMTLASGCGAVPSAESAQAVCWNLPSFGENVPLANGVNRWQGFPVAAGHPTNPTALVAAASSALTPGENGCTFGLAVGQPGPVAGSVALYGSGDSGANWQHSCAPWPPNATSAFAGANLWWQSDPHVAWDDTGTAFAVYVLHASDGPSGSAQGSALALAHSTDNGAHWAADSIPANALASSNARWAVPRMAIDNTSGGSYSHHGRKYIAYVANDVLKILFFNEVTWLWEARSIPGDATHVPAAPNLKIGADGTVYLMYTQADVTAFCDGKDNTYLVKSSSGGDTWTKRVLVDAHDYHSVPGLACSAQLSYPYDPDPQPVQRGNAYGWIDIDNNPASAFFGSLYMVTTDYNFAIDPAGNHPSETDIFFRRSLDHGASWSPRLRVNSDPMTIKTQFLPALSVDPSDGTVSVAWFDTRNSEAKADPPGSPPLWTGVQPFTARSSDGGASFGTNFNVIDDGHRFYDVVPGQQVFSLWPYHSFKQPNLVDDDPMGFKYNFGDHLAIVAANRTVHPVWIDTRNFNDQLRNRPLHEDVATMTLAYCTAPVFPNPPSVRKSGSAILVQWLPPSSWGTGACSGTYTLQRKQSGSPFWVIVAAGLSTTGWTDSGLPNGTYMYRVTATNDCAGTALTPMSTTSPQSVWIALP